VKEIVFTRRFERDFRRLKQKVPRHALDYETLEYVLALLQAGKPLPEAFREHPLERDFAGFTECHMAADWLLIYRVLRHRIVLHRTARHRDLFKSRRKR
jgi:mRNA interferase YafQ